MLSRPGWGRNTTEWAAFSSRHRPSRTTYLARILDPGSWTNLYGILTLSLREKYTQAQFVTFMQSQPPHTTTSITLSGIGTVGTTEGGVTYFAQPITFVDEQRGTLHTTLYLVSEGGQWRFLSTSAV